MRYLNRKCRRNVTIISGGFLFLSCLGYSYVVNKTTSGKEIKWDTKVVTYYINPTGGPNNALSAIQKGLDTWTNVDTSPFTLLGGSTNLSNSPTKDGTNLICFKKIENDYLHDGVATRWYSTVTGIMSEHDIALNTNFKWATDGSKNSNDVQSTITHELGHSLSLSDLFGASDSEKTMFYKTAYGETKRRTLEQDDKDGITYLYPCPPVAPSNLNASDGIYTYVYISWNSVKNVTSYDIYRATSASGSKTKLGSTIQMYYKDTTAISGTKYYYWVKAINAAGESGFSISDIGYRKK